MNLAQAHRLSRLMEEATPPLPTYWEEGENRPTVHCSLACESGNDISVRLWSPDSLVIYLDRAYIDASGVLYMWDDEGAEREQEVPCTVRWRRGTGSALRDVKFYRYMHLVAVSLDIELLAVEQNSVASDITHERRTR